MTLEPDPALEAAARRRLAAMADALAVPPATASSVVPDVTAHQPTAHRDRSRPVVLAGAGAVGALAAAIGAVVLSRADHGRDLTAGSAPGTPGACHPQVAEDGVIATGPVPGGGQWEVLVQGAPPDVSTAVLIDGVRVGGTQSDALSRAPLVNDGMFGLNAGVTEQGGIIYGQVPLATDQVEVGTEGGVTEPACPVTVPTDDLIAWFGVALQPGSRPTQVRAIDAEGRLLASGDLSQVGPGEETDRITTHMTVDPSLVPLPLGGSAIDVPMPAEQTRIESGDLPSGTWWLTVGQDHDTLVLELQRPDGNARGLQGTAEQLVGTGTGWTVESVDGRLLVWGPSPSEVSTVSVTLGDGSSLDIATVETVPGSPVRAFATTLPQGSTITAIEGRRTDGSTVLRAVDAAEQTAPLFGPEPFGSVGLSVERVD